MIISATKVTNIEKDVDGNSIIKLATRELINTVNYDLYDYIADNIDSLICDIYPEFIEYEFKSCDIDKLLEKIYKKIEND